MLSEPRLIRQIGSCHLKIVFLNFYDVYCSNLSISVHLHRRRNMMHSSLSPNTTKTGCTRSNLHIHLIHIDLNTKTFKSATSKVLLHGLENPEDGNKSFSCCLHERDWKVKNHCHHHCHNCHQHCLHEWKWKVKHHYHLNE